MNLTINIDNNLKAVLLTNTGKADINSEIRLFEGKIKKLQNRIKKSPDGKYWLFVDNADSTRRFGIALKIKNKVISLKF